MALSLHPHAFPEHLGQHNSRAFSGGPSVFSAVGQLPRGRNQINMLFLPLKHFISISSNRNSITPLIADSDKTRIFFFHLYVLPNKARNGRRSVFWISDLGIGPRTKPGCCKENKLSTCKYGFHEVTVLIDSWKETVFCPELIPQGGLHRSQSP